MVHTIRRALVGPSDETWTPPSWLLTHQVGAAQRLAARLRCFGGALLADAPGLGKTYVGLALATRYPRTVALIPATLVAQWRAIAQAHSADVVFVTHETLSRGGRIPSADLILVDEAHRFRNPETRRYDALARRVAGSHLLLLTATPVVNRAADLVHLLRLFLPDHGLAAFGVPSIERAMRARAFGQLAHAYAVLVVARSAELSPALATAIPVTDDVAVCTASPVPPHLLRRLVGGVEALAFPSFGSQEAAELLRLHLLVRLASSLAAFTATLRRHARYLDQAIGAAGRGEALSRRHARRILEPDDLQLDLPGLASLSASAPLDASRLAAERRRVEQLLDLVGSDPLPDRKAAALAELLRAHQNKTIVFTGAVATARHLARRLGWARVGLATGHGARIASGPVPMEELLGLFAPEAQGAEPAPPALQLDTLIATDLVSEGLNLQDAGAVIHYDVPWSPLRLEQRVGRAARLGSRHRVVRVAWFLPPPELEERLAFVTRIAAKVREQLDLGAASSSRIGRARVRGDLFEWRESFFLESLPPSPGMPPHYAVVRAPPSAVFALRWSFGTAETPTIVVMEGDPPVVVRDERRAMAVVRQLVSASELVEPPPAALITRLIQEVRARLTALATGPLDGVTRRLARRIVRRARTAGRQRDRATMVVLDQALERLIAGLPVGGARMLTEQLDRESAPFALSEWCSRSAPPGSQYPRITLEAALLGQPTVAR